MSELQDRFNLIKRSGTEVRTLNWSPCWQVGTRNYPRLRKAKDKQLYNGCVVVLFVLGLYRKILMVPNCEPKHKPINQSIYIQRNKSHTKSQPGLIVNLLENFFFAIGKSDNFGCFSIWQVKAHIKPKQYSIEREKKFKKKIYKFSKKN